MWQSYETLKPVAEPVPAVLRHKQSKPRKISSLRTKYLLERIFFNSLFLHLPLYLMLRLQECHNNPFLTNEIPETKTFYYSVNSVLCCTTTPQ